MDTRRKALQQAIKIAGSQLALAKILRVSQPRIHYWLNKSRNGAAAEYVLKIEQATGVPRYELRPDLWQPR